MAGADTQATAEEAGCLSPLPYVVLRGSRFLAPINSLSGAFSCQPRVAFSRWWRSTFARPAVGSGFRKAPCRGIVAKAIVGNRSRTPDHRTFHAFSMPRVGASTCSVTATALRPPSRSKPRLPAAHRRTGEAAPRSRPAQLHPLQPVAQPARSLPFCVVRYFVHVAVDTHSHGAPGVFR
jgi:hypothetical protein